LSSQPFLPFSRPTISEEAISEVVQCLRSGWITTGPRVKRFEQALSEYFETPDVQSCASATAGLLMALLSLDLKPGDEVITSPLTFVATFNTIVLAGGTPRLVDVEAGTYNLDVRQLESAIGPRTRVIMPVHFAGLPVDVDPLYALAKRHGLRVIEDCAHAIGSEYKGRRIGAFGDTQVFSFHPNKNITTGEGGCVVTRDAAMRQRIELLRFHGIDRGGEFAEFGKRGLPHYDVALAGYKFNMMDLQAALGIHQLPMLDGFIERRRQLVERYVSAFAGCDALRLPGRAEFAHRHAWHLFAPLIVGASDSLNREAFMERMKADGIGIGLHYQAPHLSRYYREQFGFAPGDFPNAEFICERIVSLPLFPGMTDADQDRVISSLMRHLAGQ
jgi:dTDP-4-amino-4,6-dideoxygalactose transaminase